MMIIVMMMPGTLHGNTVHGSLRKLLRTLDLEEEVGEAEQIYFMDDIYDRPLLSKWNVHRERLGVPTDGERQKSI